MRRSMIAAATALLVGLGSAGCASAPQADEEGPTLVRVQNYNPLAVTVEALSAGDDQRLGQVETTDTETFALPPTVQEYDLRIRVDPIGSTEVFLSDELVARRGDVIEVEVEANLDLSTVVVR